MPAPATDPVGFTAQNLRLRYFVALSLIALLTLVSQVVIQLSVADLDYDSRIVNIAGRQRMLSQKITKICLYIATEPALERRQFDHAQLQQALALWRRSHAGLQQGDAELGLPGKNSAQVTTLFQDIEANHQAMVAAADVVLANPDDAALLQSATRQLRDHETRFLHGMDAIVFRYDAEAKERVHFAKYLELGLALITLLVLVLEARFIFAPAVARLRLDMREREQREADMETLFASSPTAMLLVDTASLAIVRCNDKAAELMGCPVASLLQRPISAFLNIRHDTNRSFLEKMHAADRLSEHEVLLIDALSTSIEVLVSASHIEAAGRPVFMLGITNISEIKKAQQTLQYLATFDELTGLVNRRTGLMMLNKAIERAKRDGALLTLCYADLDGLKAVNDKYGYHEGDWMIGSVAKVLADSVRKGDVAMRLGGDEFMLVLHDCPIDEARLLMQRIERRLEQLATGQGKPYGLGLSCGLSLYEPARHTSAAGLIADADSKMVEAKLARKAAR